MSKSVTIEIPDEVYRVPEEISKDTGESMELLASEWVGKYGPRPPHFGPTPSASRPARIC
jgi:hypothetical protein